MIIDKLKELFVDSSSTPIAVFNCYYPNINDLSKWQMQSYRYIKSQIKNNNKVNIEDNVSYLYLYVYEISEMLLNGTNPIVCIRYVEQVKNLYLDHPKFISFCDNFIADIYFCIEEYDKYFNIAEAYMTGTNTCTHYANNILNAKYKLNYEVTAKELLSISNKLTKYGKENVSDVIKVMDEIIKENGKYSKQTIINNVASEELSIHKLYELDLFCGLPTGRALNEKFLKPSLKNNYICFYANMNFLSLINEFSRVAENIVRENKGLPKVNEGWINEVKLYYSIKEHFSNYKVTHQYRAKWLGRQSIDIFIENFNIGIEYQGIQHYQPVEYFGGEEAYKKGVERDKRKKKIMLIK